MAFNYLSGSSDIFNIVFNQILKISPNLLSKYITIQEQTLQLILLPHLVLFLFLFSFGWGIIPNNRGLRYLVSVVSYIYIIMQGWYGSIIVPISIAWFPLLLIFGIFLFFAFKIIHPVTVKGLGEAGASIAKDFGKRIGKDKEVERLYRELEHIEEQIGRQNTILKDAPSNSGAATAVQQLKNRKYEIKEKIRRLEGED
ncbi:hypothetical protein A3K64_01110 [Candidatus Micrarchaeota archaeon RBG_16_36_9]|nr:MAG: hypothetical protein A3K64_01110 [Candidatus Micrarchaeota archaeon RBG_16_36_9]